MNLLDCLRQKLEDSLHPVRLELEDESDRHVGHGASGAHVRVFIICPVFKGRPLIARHRMVYEALAEHLHKDVHALSIVARAPEEVEEVVRTPTPASAAPTPSPGPG
jgi:BolA protein